MVEISGKTLDLTFEDVPPPAFISFNRNCSFYGTFADRSATPKQILAQIRLDPNLFNRVEAMRQFADPERRAWQRMEIDPRNLGEMRGVLNHYLTNLLGKKPRMHQYLGMLWG